MTWARTRSKCHISARICLERLGLIGVILKGVYFVIAQIGRIQILTIWTKRRGVGMATVLTTFYYV